jgi:hypothetical protein
MVRERYPPVAAVSRPASTQTCTEAVLHIISRPQGPLRSKNSSIAA